MKKKLNLKDLQVQSFVTDVNPSEIIGASNLLGLCVNQSAVDCPSQGVLSPCLTGYYKTVPVLYCAENTLDLTLCK